MINYYNCITINTLIVKLKIGAWKNMDTQYKVYTV